METVLLVEDNRVVKMVHERLLSRAGYKVVTAADGEEALQTVREVVPDVVLLDMMLPKMSGPAVLRAIKQDPATTNVPVIVVTSLSKKNAAKLEGEGADAFLEKEQLLDSGEPLLDLLQKVLQQAASKKDALIRSTVVLSVAPARSEADLVWNASEIEATVGEPAVGPPEVTKQQ